MAEINKIQLSDGTIYDIEDTVARNNLAENFSSTSTYEVGDVVLYQGNLYQCTTAIVTAGEWDVNDWALVKMADVAGNNTNLIDAINNPTYTTTEGTDLSIDNTRVGKMKFEYYGDTEQETTTGKNLFDSSTVVAGDIINGSPTIRLSSRQALWLNVGTYTFSTTQISPLRYAITVENVGAPPLSSYPTYIFNSDWQTSSSYTFTVSTAGYCVIGFSKVNNAELTVNDLTGFNYQLETGSTATDYEKFTNGASPNPSYPQEVKTVTGENTIDIISKNQIGPLSDFIANNSSLQVTTTSTLITVTHTTTQAWIGIYKELDNLIPNSTMTLSVKGVTTTTTGYSMTVRNSGGQVVQEVIRQASGSRASFSFTVPSDGKIIIRLYAGYGDVQIGDTATFSELQLEKGTTVTSYEPYQGQSYELNLGANLFNIQKFWKENKIGSANGLRYVLEQNNAIYITGTPTNYSGCYGRGFGETEMFWTAKANHTYRILIKLSNKVSNIETRFYIGTTSHNDWNITGMTSNGIYIKDYTPTSDINFTQFSIIGAAASNTTPITAVMEIAIYDITNVSITNYQPYFEPIQLCDIEGHQDYIYNNGGKWFKHKEVGKATDSSGSTGITINDMVNNGSIFSNYGGTVSGKTITYTSAIAGINYIYYQLATPIEEEITEPTLINQLNAIKYGAESYYGQTNIIITSEELQPTLKVQTMNKIV